MSIIYTYNPDREYIGICICVCDVYYKDNRKIEKYIKKRTDRKTSRGDDRSDVCMLGKSFHTLFFAHMEDQTFLYHVLHLYIHTYTQIEDIEVYT